MGQGAGGSNVVQAVRCRTWGDWGACRPACDMRHYQPTTAPGRHSTTDTEWRRGPGCVVEGTLAGEGRASNTRGPS